MSNPIVPLPQTKIFFPGAECAACAARKELPPGSMSAPIASSIESGNSYNANSGKSNFSASAPGQPFLIPISNLFAQTCCKPDVHLLHFWHPSIVSPVTRLPIQFLSTPSPTDETVPHHSCPSRIGYFASPVSKYAISPLKNSTSVPHTPARAISITT